MIDLRSDTVTKPTAAMREAMAHAEVGDDVYGEDPTVRRLEQQTARLLGKEAALFVPSGTMGNQLGVRVHCGPGDEFLCEAECHVFYYEQGAYAQLWGVAAHPVPSQGGLPALDALRAAVRPNDPHYPRTRLLTLESTHNRWGGAVLPSGEVLAACAWAASIGLATHLDGARLWNAAVAVAAERNVTWQAALAELSAPFDTVSVCFSKGLGAPIGSALAGPAEQIALARRVRKALGGGWRQAGLLAAAALFALDRHVDRLAEDHARARMLADVILQTPGLSLLGGGPQTNLVVFGVDAQRLGPADRLRSRLAEAGVLVGQPRHDRLRAVTHLGLSDADVVEAARRIAEVASGPVVGVGPGA